MLILNKRELNCETVSFEARRVFQQTGRIIPFFTRDSADSHFQSLCGHDNAVDPFSDGVFPSSTDMHKTLNRNRLIFVG